jgi:hypothetical protein
MLPSPSRRRDSASLLTAPEIPDKRSQRALESGLGSSLIVEGGSEQVIAAQENP